MERLEKFVCRDGEVCNLKVKEKKVKIQKGSND